MKTSPPPDSYRSGVQHSIVTLGTGLSYRALIRQSPVAIGGEPDCILMALSKASRVPTTSRRAPATVSGLAIHTRAVRCMGIPATGLTHDSSMSCPLQIAFDGSLSCLARYLNILCITRREDPRFHGSLITPFIGLLHYQPRLHLASMNGPSW